MTLERLILSTLAEGRIVTAHSVAKQWGEDPHRVDGYLKRFVKRGLCTSGERVVGRICGERMIQVRYTPDKGKVRLYINELNVAAA